MFCLLAAWAISAMPRLTDGVVVDKTYNQAYTIVRTRTTLDANGSARVTQDPVFYPASWQICVEGSEGDGKARTEWWTVGEGIYERIAIGDHVRRNPDTGMVSINEEKRRSHEG